MCSVPCPIQRKMMGLRTCMFSWGMVWIGASNLNLRRQKLVSTYLTARRKHFYELSDIWPSLFYVIFLFKTENQPGITQIITARTLLWGPEMNITSTEAIVMVNQSVRNRNHSLKWKLSFYFTVHIIYFFYASTVIPLFKIQISLWSRWIISENKCIELLYLVYLD